MSSWCRGSAQLNRSAIDRESARCGSSAANCRHLRNGASMSSSTIRQTIAPIVATRAVASMRRAASKDSSASGTRPGPVWLRQHLIEAAHATARTRGNHLAARHAGISARRGSKRAAVATGRTILIAAWSGCGFEGDPVAEGFEAAEEPPVSAAGLRRASQ
jgi:hypothetical protein